MILGGIGLVLAVLFMPGVVLAHEPRLGPIPASVLRVVDGDTIEVMAHIWIGHTVTTRVRLEGIDTAELPGRCAAEKSKAQAARLLVQEIIRGAPVLLHGVRSGKYAGRVIAEVTTQQGINVGQALLDAHLARPYGGGKRYTWCDGKIPGSLPVLP